MSETHYIGQNLIRLRAKQGVTGAELAATIGVSQNTISQWETGKKIPRAINLQKLAKFYNVSPEEITSNPVVPESSGYHLENNELVDFDHLLTSNARLVFDGKVMTPKEKTITKNFIKYAVVNDEIFNTQKVEEPSLPYPTSNVIDYREALAAQQTKEKALTDQIESALNHAVAASGKRLSNENREFFKKLLLEKLEDNED